MTSTATTSEAPGARATPHHPIPFILLGVCTVPLLCSFVAAPELFIVYLIVVGGFEFAIIALAVGMLAVVKLFHRKFFFSQALAKFAVFNLWLLIFGLIGNSVWDITAYGRLYINHDPVVEWIPFILPGQWTIDPVCGGSLTPGTRWLDMYLAWFAIALPVWVLAFFCYRWTTTCGYVQEDCSFSSWGRPIENENELKAVDCD